MAKKQQFIRVRAKNRAIKGRLMRGIICTTRGVSYTDFPKNTLGREPHPRFRAKGPDSDVAVEAADPHEVGEYLFRQEQMRRMSPSQRDLAEAL